MIKIAVQLKLLTASEAMTEIYNNLSGKAIKTLPLVEAINLILLNILQNIEDGNTLSEAEIKQIKDLLENGTGGTGGTGSGFTKTQIINFIREDLKANKVTGEMLKLDDVEGIIGNYLSQQGITKPHSTSEIYNLIRDYLTIENPNLISDKVAQEINSYLTNNELPKNKTELTNLIATVAGSSSGSGGTIDPTVITAKVEEYFTNNSLPKTNVELKTFVSTFVSSTEFNPNTNSINNIIRQYLQDNPIQTLSDQNVKDIIRTYLQDNPISSTGLTEQEVENKIIKYFTDNELPKTKQALIQVIQNNVPNLDTNAIEQIVSNYITTNNIGLTQDQKQDIAKIDTLETKITSLEGKVIKSVEIADSSLKITLEDNTIVQTTLPNTSGGNGGTVVNTSLFKEFEVGEVQLSTLPVISGTGNNAICRVNFNRTFSEIPIVTINADDKEQRIHYIVKPQTTHFDYASNYFNGGRKIKYFAYVINKDGGSSGEILTTEKANELFATKEAFSKSATELTLSDNKLVFKENGVNKEIILPSGSGTGTGNSVMKYTDYLSLLLTGSSNKWESDILPYAPKYTISDTYGNHISIGTFVSITEDPNTWYFTLKDTNDETVKNLITSYSPHQNTIIKVSDLAFIDNNTTNITSELLSGTYMNRLEYEEATGTIYEHSSGKYTDLISTKQKSEVFSKVLNNILLNGANTEIESLSDYVYKDKIYYIKPQLIGSTYFSGYFICKTTHPIQSQNLGDVFNTEAQFLQIFKPLSVYTALIPKEKPIIDQMHPLSSISFNEMKSNIEASINEDLNWKKMTIIYREDYSDVIKTSEIYNLEYIGDMSNMVLFNVNTFNIKKQENGTVVFENGESFNLTIYKLILQYE